MKNGCKNRRSEGFHEALEMSGNWRRERGSGVQNKQTLLSHSVEPDNGRRTHGCKTWAVKKCVQMISVSLA